MTGNLYTPTEDAILVKHWIHGYRATAAAFTAAGLEPRSVASAQSRVVKLRLAGHNIPFASGGRRESSPGGWSQDELAILVREYPLGGSSGVRAALVTAGYQDRASSAVQSRVQRFRTNGVHISSAPRTIPRASNRSVQDRIVSTLTMYNGMPLTVVDIAYELYISRREVFDVLLEMVAAGVVRSRNGQDGTVYTLEATEATP